MVPQWTNYLIAYEDKDAIQLLIDDVDFEADLNWRVFILGKEVIRLDAMQISGLKLDAKIWFEGNAKEW